MMSDTKLLMARTTTMDSRRGAKMMGIDLELGEEKEKKTHDN